MSEKRTILHITAGDTNWDPTEEELESIADIFHAATIDPEGSVVVTRSGISVKLLEVQEDTEICVCSAHVDANKAKELAEKG